MDYQPQNQQGGQNGYNPYPYGVPIPPRQKGEGMATAAMVLGIISLIGLALLQLYLPFLLGGVGIILAILSRGSAKKVAGRAKAGMICCIISLCISIAFFALSFWFLLSLPKLSPGLAEEVNKIYEEQYGVSYEEMMKEFYDMWNIE